MNSTRCSHRWQAAALATLLATALSAGQATAVMLHDPALPYPSTSAYTPTREPCWLSRVGTSSSGATTSLATEYEPPGG